MRISGITCCLDYADKLERGLAEWADGLDDLLVATAPEDTATLELCRSLAVPTFVTDAFTADGAILNKALVLSLAFDYLNPQDWVLFFDADCCPPPGGFRQRVERENPRPGMLYGARRQDEQGAMLPDSELAGFFMLFHSGDSAAQERPLFGSWLHAGAFDSAFTQRWPREWQRILPLVLAHLGKPGRNWCGIGGEARLHEAMRERNRRGGWTHERLR